MKVTADARRFNHRVPLSQDRPICQPRARCARLLERRTASVEKMLSSRAQRGTFRGAEQRSLATLGMTPSANQVLYQRRLTPRHFHDHLDRVFDALSRVFDGGRHLGKSEGVGMDQL